MKNQQTIIMQTDIKRKRSLPDFNIKKNYLSNL